MIPKIEVDLPNENTIGNRLKFIDFVRNFTLLLPYLDLMICFLGYGLIASMLQPYLSQCGANSSQISNTFLIYGVVYMIASLITGYVRYIPKLS